LLVALEVEKLAGAVQEALAREAPDQRADGWKHHIGEKPLSRRHNGMPFVLAHAEKGSLLRTWNQGEDLGEKLGGWFFSIRDFRQKRAESKQVRPVIA
jgi:hypothetical protein